MSPPILLRNGPKDVSSERPQRTERDPGMCVAMPTVSDASRRFWNTYIAWKYGCCSLVRSGFRRSTSSLSGKSWFLNAPQPIELAVFNSSATFSWDKLDARSTTGLMKLPMVRFHCVPRPGIGEPMANSSCPPKRFSRTK